MAWAGTDLAPAGLASPTASKLVASIGVPSHAEHATRAASRDETMLRIDVATRQLDAAREEFVQLDRDLNRAEVATEELRHENRVVAEQTLENAINAYRNKEVPVGLLTADDLTSSLRATTLVGAAVSSDTEGFDRYRDLRKDLEIQQSELESQRQQVDLASATMVGLEEELTAELLWFGELEERRLQEQAAAVAAAASNRAQARGRKQGFYLDTCPVNGPHEFIDSWGFARSGGRRHQGVDMLAPRGTELVAPISGLVEHYSNNLGGRSFRLFDEDGNYFYGTHMSGFGKSGQVRAGEVIGYVGDDGNAAGINHLHFELHPGGRGNPINPFIDTAAVCSGAQN